MGGILIGMAQAGGYTPAPYIMVLGFMIAGAAIILGFTQ
jgi:hypothetical protein